MKDPTLAPIYACLYPELTAIARKHGYAMAVHGTLGRDFDLICIPWIEYPSEPQSVVDEIVTTFALKQVDKPTFHLHLRLVYTLTLAFGECFLDLSFMPSVK